MTYRMNDWYYRNEETGEWSGPVTLEQLDELSISNRIYDHTEVLNAEIARRSGPVARGIQFSSIPRIAIEFAPPTEEFLDARFSHFATVLCGPNNCGKTLYLRQIFAQLGHDAYLVQCNRFSHVDVLNTRQLDQHEYRRYYDDFLYNFHTALQNTENNNLQLDQLITSLKDKALERLFKLATELLGNKFSLKQVDPESKFSPYYIDMDGQNLRYGSSGTRLLFTLLGTLLDERFNTVLIDEPEIGLSPRIQATLARFLFSPDLRAAFCPHLKQVYVATHSHLFLDRGALSNNFILSKQGNYISVTQVKSLSALHHLQFNLLGNDLEAMSLPSVIILVEGDSDLLFLGRLFQIHLPQKRVSIVRAGGDGEIQNKVNVLKETFGELTTSPYRERIFVVLDAKNSASKGRLQNQGLNINQIRIWSQNGIEYLYPERILTTVFHCSIHELADLNRENDPISLNGIRKTKKELAHLVSDSLTADDTLHPEMVDFLSQVKSACSKPA